MNIIQGTREPLPRVRESEIQRAVIAHWRKLGVPGSLVAAIPNAGAMGQYGLTKGLPDLLVMAPGLPVGFIELKAKVGGRLSEAQLDFKMNCANVGAPYALTYGRDEPIAILEKWNVVRVAR
jgi:hypothetical protein